MNNKQILETFWAMMATNDFHAAAQLLHEEYTLEWPQSGETIRGREHFALINTHYPAEGMWQFKINAIVVENNVVVTDVSVTDGRRHDRAVTFSTIRDGKIWKQVEFWPERFEAPAWRAGWVEKI
jgi:ketosteroid isomerase-like protein